MSRNVVTSTATGAAAIAHSLTLTNNCEIICVTIHFSAAPTTSENLTITLNAKATAPYDTVLLIVDPSVDSATDIFWIPEKTLRFVAGDAIDIAYTNTDTRTYGVQIYYDTNPQA